MTAPAYAHGGDVLAAAARWGLDPAAILDFSANINPAGPPPGALAAAHAALAGGVAARYPEPFAATLRAELARRHDIDPASVMVGNGAAELIHLLGRLAPGGRVAVPVPGFAEYARAARAVGAEVVPAGTRADLTFINNPHNPTGALLTPAQVLARADAAAAPRALTVVDEAFIDLTDVGESGSVIGHAPRRRDLAVVRSLTKFYALPGLRVGYAVAHPDLIARLDRERDPWSVSATAQAAALAALDDHAYAAATRAWVRAERAFLAGELARLPGYRVWPPSANYILAEAPEPAWQIQQRLGPRGILVRDCRSFEGLTERHMRLAVRSRPENLRLLDELRS